jgi:putative membrane protein
VSKGDTPIEFLDFAQVGIAGRPDAHTFFSAASKPDGEGDEMKRIFSIVCCVALCAVPALAQKSAAPMSDQKFLETAAQTDMIEAHLGKLAQDAAASQSVKDYGQMLVTDHTNDYSQLQSLAQQTGLAVPTAIDAQHDKAMIAPMHALKGTAFDHKYIQEMVAGHTGALALYKKEAHDAQNPAIRSYAEQTIPALQKHLDDAKAIREGKTPSM